MVRSIVLALFFLTSCTSALKKRCQQTNWFNHGKSVAMEGKRLDADNFVMQCQKEEVPVSFSQLDLGFKSGMNAYCEPENVYGEGRSGKFFNFDMCFSGVDHLKKRHQQGVIAFCTNDGKKAGASGYIYKNICPKNLEDAFLPNYDIGRKIYLKGMIKQKKREIASIDTDVRDLRRKEVDIRTEIRRIPKGNKVIRERKFDLKTRKWTEEVKTSTDQDSKRRIQMLERNLRSVDRKITKKRKEQKALMKSIGTLEIELNSL